MNPAATFVGYLKQLDTGKLADNYRFLLNVLFSEFMAEEKRMEPYKNLGAKYVYGKYQSWPVEWGRMKRFAGSPSLGGGRYYSLCRDPGGFDNGTLRKELMSYWNFESMIYPRIFDTTLLTKEQVDKDYPGLDEPLLIIGAKEYYYQTNWLGKRSIKESKEYSFNIPLTVKEVAIDNVIDLRIPHVQDWFYKTFFPMEDEFEEQRADRQIKMVKLYKCKNFVEMLPTLVFPGLGGSSFHQAVGAWLRSNGINGLVFPSARCNCLTKMSPKPQNPNEYYLSFYGWNFVDYRNSSPADWGTLFGRLPSWMTPDKARIEIETFDLPDYGWQISGAEEGERRRVDFAYDIMTGKTEAPHDWNSRGSYRRPFYEKK